MVVVVVVVVVVVLVVVVVVVVAVSITTPPAYINPTLSTTTRIILKIFTWTSIDSAPEQTEPPSAAPRTEIEKTSTSPHTAPISASEILLGVSGNRLGIKVVPIRRLLQGP